MCTSLGRSLATPQLVGGCPMHWIAYAAGALLLSLSLAGPAAAEVDKVLISYQPGLTFMPMILAGKNKLIQKHAAAAGVGNLTVDWVLLASGGASVEALISGNLDVVTTGATNLLAAWGPHAGRGQGAGGLERCADATR